MISKSPSTIRWQLTRLVVVAALPVWLVSGFLVFQAYSAKRDQVNLAMLGTARSLTMVVDRELTNVQSALSGLATSPAFSAGDFGGVHRQARELLQFHPGADIIVADATGQQLVNSFLPYGTPLPKRKTPETVRRVFETGKPVVSDLFYGALTGRPLIGIDIPVVVDGKVEYDLAMTFPAASLNDVLLKQGLPSDQYATILDSRQIVVTRSLHPENCVGKRVTLALRQSIALASEGTGEATNLEAQPVFVTFCRSAFSGWTVTVGVPKASVYAKVYTWTTWAIAAAATILSIGIALAAGHARRITRAIQSLVAPALAIGRGELLVAIDRTDIKQTGEVAAALMQASDLLHARHEKLRESEHRYAALFDNELSGMAHCRVVTDGLGRPIDFLVLRVNEACERILGIEKGQIEGRMARDISPGFEKSAFDYIGVLGRVALEGRATFFESFFNPTRQHLSISAHSSLPGEFTAIFADITGRKRAEEALKRTGEQLRLAMEAADLGMWDLDLRTGRVGHSLRHDQIYGYRELQPEWTMELALQHVVSDDRQRVREAHERIDQTGGLSVETQVRWPDGNLHWIRSQGRIHSEREGRQVRIIGIVADITEHKRAEEARLRQEGQLLQARKLESLGVLAGGIAHDFNNILMAIYGNADLAVLNLDRESPALENLQIIQQSAERAADLTKQMLAYSGKGKFFVEGVDLNVLLERMLPQLQASTSGKAVLRLLPHLPLPQVSADATQMRQIVLNLVNNAFEAIEPEVGVITLTTGYRECDRGYLDAVCPDQALSEGLYVYLGVEDNGCGMTGDTMEKMFDPFFTTKFTGRGLGLAAVLGIVKGHQGVMAVRSAPGAGTSFRILLPADDLRGALPLT